MQLGWLTNLILFFHFPEKIESADKKSKYIYSIPYINLIKHVLVQSPVKTTPENSRKGGHGQGSPWRLEDNPSKSESMYISRVSLRIADPEVKSGGRECARCCPVHSTDTYCYCGGGDDA